jgi:glutamine cyclotransferase
MNPNLFLKYIILIVLIISDTVWASLAERRNETIPVYTYFIVNKIPHDHRAYTQGLVFDNGFLYEGTGRRGQSSLRKVDPINGAIINIHFLADELFGEGITIYDNKIYQLTWQAYTGFVYDKDSFLFMEEFFYNTEGWGITHDNQNLIVSDGSATLYFLDPVTFEVLKQIEVTDNNGPVGNLNELEYIKGEIYANILSSNRIARINPQNGKISSWIDLTGILGGEKIDYAIDVLNGIAYDHENDRLFVTGKYWPKIFEIKLLRQAD